MLRAVILSTLLLMFLLVLSGCGSNSSTEGPSSDPANPENTQKSPPKEKFRLPPGRGS
jgi:predicted small lipoprotein YifL